jgi:hypothetical protein
LTEPRAATQTEGMPRWTFFDAAVEIELFERHDLSAEELAKAQTPEAARSILNRILVDRDNRHGLVDVARALGDFHGDARHLSFDRLNDILKRAVHDGRLVLLRGHHHPIPGGGKKVEPPAPPPPGPDPKPPRPAKLSWIEVNFLGEDGTPASGEHYQLQLPDGSVREGVVPKSGTVRIEKLDPGTCKVFMPDLQAAEWSA